jgi:hypothetical protein
MALYELVMVAPLANCDVDDDMEVDDGCARSSGCEYEANDGAVENIDACDEYDAAAALPGSTVPGGDADPDPDDMSYGRSCPAYAVNGTAASSSSSAEPPRQVLHHRHRHGHGHSAISSRSAHAPTARRCTATATTAAPTTHPHPMACAVHATAACHPACPPCATSHTPDSTTNVNPPAAATVIHLRRRRSPLARLPNSTSCMLAAHNVQCLVLCGPC